MDCRFEYINYFGPFGRHYSCRGLSFMSYCNDRNINSASGNHKPKLNADNIAQIFIDNQHSECMPQNLPTLFKNILVLCVRNSKMHTLHSNDLEGMSQLKVLDLGWNKIETIPAQFFDPTPNIEQISIRANKVKHVGINISQLNRLKTMWMDSNICVKMVAQNAVRLQKLNERMTNDCPMLNSDTTTRATTTLITTLRTRKITPMPTEPPIQKNDNVDLDFECGNPDYQTIMGLIFGGKLARRAQFPWYDLPINSYKGASKYLKAS